MLPETTLTRLAPAAVAVCVNTTGDPARDGALARAVWVPATEPSVRVTDARPSAAVVVVAALTLPPPVTVQVIVTPDFGFPKASATWITNRWPKVDLTWPDWLLPLTADISLADAGTAVAANST